MINPDRRSLLLAALGITANTSNWAIEKPNSDFDVLFADALQHPENLEAVRNVKEARDVLGSKAVAPRLKRSCRVVAPEAIRMIVLFEVTNERRYTSRYERPLWPGGESGVTIGIGCDLGYMRKDWLASDWGAYVDPTILAGLEQACGATGSRAKELIPKLSHISVPWSSAMTQFNNEMLPLYIGATLQSVPLAEKLSDKSLGALVSLVYNRGPSFSKLGERYKEMRAIKEALQSGAYTSIPGHILDMRRLWSREKFPGLHQRRELEAALFKEGLT